MNACYLRLYHNCKGRAQLSHILAAVVFFLLLQVCTLTPLAAAVSLPRWSKVDIVSSDPDVICGCVDIDDKDRVNLVWAERNSNGKDQVFFRRLSKDLEVVNGRREMLTADGLTWLGCSSDVNNDLHVLFLDKKGMGYTKVSYSGITIIKTKYVLTGVAISHPDMDVDHNRNIHMVYEAAQNGTTQVIYSRLDRSGSPILGPLIIDALNSTEPDICTDGRGSMFVTWLCFTQNRTELRFNTYSEDMAISSQLMMSSFTTQKSDPCVTCDVDGNRYVLWYDYSIDPQHPSIQMSWADKSDTVWLRDHMVFASGAYAGELAAVAGSKGNIHILWYESASDDTLDYCILDPNGRMQLAPLWLESGVDVLPKDTGPRYCIATDSEGWVHVVWVQQGLRYVDSDPRDDAQGPLGPNTDLKMALIVIMIVAVVLMNIFLIGPRNLRRKKKDD